MNIQRLTASRERFQNLVQEAPTATAVLTGRDMVVELVNQRMLQIWDVDG